MNSSNRSWHFIPIFILLLLLTSISLPLPLKANPSHIDYDHGTLVSVSQYKKIGPNRTGNNNYFAMDAHLGTSRVGVVAGGREDLLLYQDDSFKIKRMDPLIYHRDIEWINDGKEALTAASRIPPDTGGVIMKYQSKSNQFQVLKKTPVNILGLTSTDQNIFAVGGQRIPTLKSVIYQYQSGNLQTIDPPQSVVYHDISKHPDRKNSLLIVGEQGTILLMDDSQEFQLEEVPGQPILNKIAWHPNQNYALIGGEGGRLYRYEDGNTTRISLNIDWTIHDIAWHPDGEFAILVGTIGAQDKGYWGRYSNLSIKSYPVKKPLFSAEWMDGYNALLGGQRTLWRYSLRKNINDFDLEASLSVSHKSVPVSNKLTLSGFGSTFKGSSDSVAQYLFKSETGETSGWQNHPDFTVSYDKSGIHQPTLVVKGEGANQKASDRARIKVGDSREQNTFFDFLFQNTRTTFLVIGVILLIVATWMFRGTTKL